MGYISSVQNYFSNVFCSKREERKILQEAIVKGSAPEVAKILAEHKEWLLEPLPNGEVPLYFAIRCHSLEIVKEMLQNKPDLFRKDDQGLTAFDHAVFAQDAPILTLLLQEIAKMSLEDMAKALQEKGGMGKEIAQLKAEEKADPNTPLHVAALRGEKDEVERLLKGAPSFSNVSLSPSGKSPLYFAAIGGHPLIVNLFADQWGVDALQQKDFQGNTPLHYAALGESLFAAQALIEKGANPLEKNKSDLTPLATIVHLIKERADARDPLKLSPYDWMLCANVLASWGCNLLLPAPYASFVSLFPLVASILQTAKEKSYTEQAKWFARNLICAAFPEANVLAQTFRIWITAKNTFRLLTASFRNRSLDTVRSLQATFVSAINGVYAGCELSKAIHTVARREEGFGNYVWRRYEEFVKKCERAHECDKPFEETKSYKDLNCDAEFTLEFREDHYEEYKEHLRQCGKKKAEHLLFCMRSTEKCSEEFGKNIPRVVKDFLGFETSDSPEERLDREELKPEFETDAAILLGISSADCEHATRAYRKLARQFHPDKVKCPPSDLACQTKVNERFLKLQQSRETLCPE